MGGTVLIFGGSGFIGTKLCELFTSLGNDDFLILDKKNSIKFPLKSISADIRSLGEISAPISSAGAIINLAAEHRDDVYPLNLYDEVNVGGARNICQLARDRNVNKIIFTSSVAIYGFAPIGTDESGEVAPFNDYGRTKWEAEQLYKEWQSEDHINRTLVIVRPTVVFGERNRGNFYNLLRQIAMGKFVMVGGGLNRKSIAYVDNVASFLAYALSFNPGVHIYNYVDKPDLTMNALIWYANKLLGRSADFKFRLPLFIGLLIGSSFDLIAKITGKKFSISTIRVKKFCANSVYGSAVESTGFIPPVPLMDAIEKTVHFEFIEGHKDEEVFYSE